MALDSKFNPIPFNNSNISNFYNPMVDRNYNLFEGLNPSVASTPDISTIVPANVKTAGVLGDVVGTGADINAPSGLNIWDRFKSTVGDAFKTPVDKEGTAGLSPALQIGKLGLDAFGAWQQMQQLDLLQDELNFKKDAFSKQFNIQKDITRGDIQDRNVARRAANPTTGLSDAQLQSKYKSLYS